MVQAAETVAAVAAPQRAGYGKLVVTWVLLVVSVLAWREGVYFSGGIDPVVIGKSLLVLMALWIAWLEAARRRRIAVVGARSFAIVSSYVVITTLGGWASGSGWPVVDSLSPGDVARGYCALHRRRLADRRRLSRVVDRHGRDRLRCIHRWIRLRPQRPAPYRWDSPAEPQSGCVPCRAPAIGLIWRL